MKGVKVKGLDKKSTNPLTKAKAKAGGKAANRKLKGADGRKPGKGKTGWKPKSLEGKLF